LIRRYLIWCYKTTKEELDRTDRYFTQLIVDDIILHELSQEEERDSKDDAEFLKKTKKFKQYIYEKQRRVFSQKFADSKGKKLQPEYRYLKSRMVGIEKALVSLLGEMELKAVQSLYEKEMTRRILEAKEQA